jgi:NADH:ubiquinone reductase (non-electrogenic)
MKKRIVVLGTGFSALRFLKEIDKSVYDVYVVSPRNHFLFTPLLASTTVGTIEFRSIIEPIRNINDITYYMAKCKSINSANSKIVCKDDDNDNEFEIEFDYLIIAVGEKTNTFNIEGVKEYALFIREVADARRIRISVIEKFEDASLPGISDEEKRRLLRFVVCGGGPTGVEFAAELHDFIEQDVKKKYKDLERFVEIILVEALDTILGSFNKKLSEYAMKIFKRQNIILKINTLVTKVTKNKILLKDETSIEYSILVWAAGNAAVSLVADSNLPKDKRNKILTDPYFKVTGYDNIFSIGDCAEIQNDPLPATAQVAQQQGFYLGKYFNQLAKNKQPNPFDYKSMGMLAYIGSHKALADTPQFKGTGFKSWIFWRSIYITKLVSIKNKILVLFDWFKNFLFGRDVSKF